jgi:hypothetical protein
MMNASLVVEAVRKIIGVTVESNMKDFKVTDTNIFIVNYFPDRFL